MLAGLVVLRWTPRVTGAREFTHGPYLHLLALMIRLSLIWGGGIKLSDLDPGPSQSLIICMCDNTVLCTPYVPYSLDYVYLFRTAWPSKKLDPFKFLSDAVTKKVLAEW